MRARGYLSTAIVMMPPLYSPGLSGSMLCAEFQKVAAAMAARREFDVFLQIHGAKG
ncbi:MAG: hypothetical protein ACLPX9_14525 [Rhodomicrobium sp.]